MIIGIDLGTTNSLAAVWRDGRAELIPNSLGETLTPSVVSLSDDERPLIGRAARERLITHAERSVDAFKRYMGSDRRIHLGRRTFRPQELSALVLKALKADAEHYLGQPVEEAVISVPAYFNDAQRKATRLAGELAGLRVERLINEPTAAALAYGLHDSADENRFLVFDLGGGTFDVSILELFDGVMEVHACAGDNYLGGEDFVDVLVRAFSREHGLEDGALDSCEENLLRARMERAKRTLNNHRSARVSLTRSGADLDWAISQEEYERLAAPLLERLRLPVERAMRDAGLRLGDIDEVILVGGSTRKLIVQKLVARMFGRLPLRQINPDEVVALGAAVQAGLKARDETLSEVVLTDVCPYTLGVESSSNEGGRQVDGLFSPIIERNTVIPASRVQTFYPMLDSQSEVLLNVYQGESPFVKDNMMLGALKVPLPGLKREDSGVDVRFTYDVNGLLEVEAAVLATGTHHALVVEQSEGSLSPEEIEQSLARLADLKIHPRDEAQNQALLARAERLYQESLEGQREDLGRLIAQFTAVLESQKPREIHRARIALAQLLDELESERVF
jgi:molecular chaperone HscC